MLYYKLFNNYISTSVRVGLFFLLLFVLHSSLLRGQENYTEIENRLADMADDTAKANRLLTLGEHYCSIENDKALMFLQEANAISTSLGYTKGIGKSLMWQGRVYYYKDNYLLSNNYLDKAKAPLEKIHDIEALSFLYFSKASNAKITGDYVHAIEMYKTAIEMAKQSGNKKRVSTCYLGIGTILLDRQEVEKALPYFIDALLIKQKIGDEAGISNVFSCIAHVYNAKGLPDSSLLYFQKSLKIRTRLNMKRKIASSEYNIGGILLKLGKYDEAEKSLNHALNLFSLLDEKTGVIITNLRKAKVMNKLGNPASVSLATEMLEQARSIQNLNLVSHACQTLSEIFGLNKDYKNAFEYQKMHNAIHDSLFNKEKERMLAEMEAKFQSEKKDNKIRFLTTKNAIQRKNNILLIVLMVVFAVMVILLFFLFRIKSTAYSRQQKLHEQENIINNQEKQIIQQEKKLLQEQLESKNRELASKALEMIRYNDAISSIVEKLETMSQSLKANPEAQNSINDIIKDIDSNTKQNIWDEFEKVFKNIHSDFYKKLIEVCPDISSSEIKIAALLKLNLTTKEIAAITYKSEGGIKTTRYRLRQKLKLSSDEKLIPFLMQL